MAAYRLAHVLAGVDSLLEGVQRSVKEWAWECDDCGEPLADACKERVLRPVGRNYDGWRWPAAVARGKVAALLTCPFCLGWHIIWAMDCVWFGLWPWQLGWSGWIITLGQAGVQSFLTAVDGR